MNSAIVAILTFAASPLGQKLIADGEEVLKAAVKAIFQHAVTQVHSQLPSTEIK